MIVTIYIVTGWNQTHGQGRNQGFQVLSCAQWCWRVSLCCWGWRQDGNEADAGNRCCISGICWSVILTPGTLKGTTSLVQYILQIFGPNFLKISGAGKLTHAQYNCIIFEHLKEAMTLIRKQTTNQYHWYRSLDDIRPLKSHDFTMRLTVFRTISRSHYQFWKSNGKRIHKLMHKLFWNYWIFEIQQPSPIFFEGRDSTNIHIWKTSVK